MRVKFTLPRLKSTRLPTILVDMKHKILITAAISLFAATSFAQTYDQQTAPSSPKRIKKNNRSVAQEQEQEQEQPPASQPWDQLSKRDRTVRGMILAGYNVGNKAKFGSIKGTVSNIPVTGNYEASVESAFYIGGGAIYAPTHSLGFSSSLVFEMKRDISGYSATVNGNSVTSTYTNKPLFQFMYVETNGLYRLEQFYFLGGVNYSIPSFTPSSGSSSALEVSGALGWQVGVGFVVNENLHLNGYWKRLAAEASEKDASISADLQYGTGNLDGLAFQANYLF
jgi:hypothetical protein